MRVETETNPLPLGETKNGSVNRRNIATQPTRRIGKGKKQKTEKNVKQKNKNRETVEQYGMK